VAAAVGIDRKSQSLFERDVHLPGGKYLIALNALGVDINQVLLGVPGARNSAEAELLVRFRAASHEVQGAVLGALGVPAGGQGAAVAITGDGHGQVVAGNVSQRGVTFNVAGKKKGAGK
jgi:hypothetical protein